MTERAKRAADELRRRGWSIDGYLNPVCVACACDTTRGAMYCAHCGARVAVPDTDTMTDLEAAIVAATEQGEKA